MYGKGTSYQVYCSWSLSDAPQEFEPENEAVIRHHVVWKNTSMKCFRILSMPGTPYKGGDPNQFIAHRLRSELTPPISKRVRLIRIVSVDDRNILDTEVRACLSIDGGDEYGLSKR